MILVTRLNGSVFALNPDLVERADRTPDTVVTLVDGTKYVITESIAEFVDLVRHYRASLLADAQRMIPVGDSTATGDPTDHDDTDNGANVVQLHRRER